EVLVELGVGRVLTSGGARRALEAMPELARLAELGGQTTRILCGGGVRSSNVAELMGIPGVREFHSAARPSPMVPVEESEVRALRAAIDGEA
ncbi:MAG: copper homeostasis protein CutC, partial [Verrucomicrobiales bacterium]